MAVSDEVTILCRIGACNGFLQSCQTVGGQNYVETID
jgi:hypothetical protein